MTLPEDQTTKLTFETQPGAWRSKAIAGAVAAGLVAWMGSGYVFPTPQEAPQARAMEKVLTTVGFKTLQKQKVSRVFFAEGETLPFRNTTIRSAVSGEVVALPLEKGINVEEGDVIVTIDQETARLDLERARKEFEKARQDFKNTEELLKKGIVTQDRRRETEAALAAARSEAARAQQALEDTSILAPYTGKLEELNVEVGEYITAGTEVASVIETVPLKISFNVPQSIQGKITEGQSASLRFANGELGEAIVTYVGNLGSSETRTFKAEAFFSNPTRAIPAGMSASVSIPYAEIEGHFISPAIIATNEDGILGVKVINDDDTIAFTPIEIIRSQKEGVWVTGIPDEARVVTIGQGYVSDGESVTAKPDNR